MRSKFRKWINTVLAVLLLVGMLPFRGTQTVAENTASPKISVIIPVYNVEPYLRQCLDSVVNQTLKDIEIICIDDCSTDNSLEILKEYAQKDGRIVLIHMEVNQGAYVARNKGLEVASGEYIGFVDPDDYIELNTYEVSYNTARQNDADIVVFGGKSFGKKNNWADKKLNTRKASYMSDSYSALFNENGAFPYIWNKIYRRKMISESRIRFRSDRYGMDNVFCFMVFPIAKKILFVSNSFYHWRQRTNSATDTKWNDINNKTWLSFNISKYISSEWKGRGYIKGNELYLLRRIWQRFDEIIKNLDTETKKSLCGKLLELIEKNILGAYNPKDLPQCHKKRLLNLRNIANDL